MRELLTNQRTGQAVSAWFGEPRPGLEAAVFADYVPSMRLVTRDDVQEGDTLVAASGERYRVARVRLVGGRIVAELAKVT